MAPGSRCTGGSSPGARVGGGDADAVGTTAPAFAGAWTMFASAPAAVTTLKVSTPAGFFPGSNRKAPIRPSNATATMVGPSGNFLISCLRTMGQTRTNFAAPARWQPEWTVLVTPIAGLVSPTLKLCVPRSTQPDVPVVKLIVVVVVPDASFTVTSPAVLALTVFQI